MGLSTIAGLIPEAGADKVEGADNDLNGASIVSVSKVSNWT